MATVVQMRKSDERSDHRHQQAMELMIRTDRLALERALVPQIDDIKECGLASKNILDEFHQYIATSDNDDPPPMEDWWYQFSDVFDFIVQTIDRPHFREGERLFDGDLMYRIWDLRRRTDEVRNFVRVAEDYFAEAEPNARAQCDFAEWRINGEGVIADYVRYSAVEIPGIVAGLKRMGALYNVL
ncbi:hypothetical protein [Ensifer adhaerens]|uniref:hypothetical protein n=1 Tax=Ensifer adhaerens TaxID=106592 RepID=UPI000FD8604D|nr:hypothetical protein [Ensifer adhaerens]MDF8358997.1 hypothetical protein [Ensifer adhaerens]THA68363.1 hypothetical protein E5176_05060 [Ensifer adhaerens]